MTNLFSRAFRRDITTLDDYVQAVTYAGNQYALTPHVEQTLTGDRVELPGADWVEFARRMSENSIVAACMSMRAYVFSAVRLVYQRMESGRPSTLFGTQDLALFESPWTGGTTQDLLARMMQDIDLAGNSYWVRRGVGVPIGDDRREELVWLKPDLVDIILERRSDQLGFSTIGYLYWQEGRETRKATPLLVDEVAHFMPPTPDPYAPWRGKTWLRTVFREVANDRLMERHKSRTFEQGATPNMVIKFGDAVDDDAFEEYVTKFRRAHDGPENAGKTLFLSPGMDMEVVGRDFQQLDFSGIQGHSETRIAAAAGVPPQIIPFSEGMQGSSLNANVYSSARRRFADATMHPLWQMAAGSLAILAQKVPGARLWYDTRDVPFIRDDESDIAGIQQSRSQTLRTLVDAGYTAESAVAAVEGDDFGLLVHSGLFSVQLQPPGTQQAPGEGTDEGEPMGEGQ